MKYKVIKVKHSKVVIIIIINNMSAMNVNVSQVMEEVSGVIAPVVFNASITVTELLTKTLENCAKELAARCIRECAAKYGFVAEDEIRALGLENLNLIKKKMTKKSGSKSSSSSKKPIAQKKEKKSVFPMPFEASEVVETNCQGLAFNRGLFTQCSKEKMENSTFCKSCQTEADKNSSGNPDCGTVHSRLATELYSFKDPKGRSPVSYVKLLEKLKLSAEDALTEAGNKNIELSEEHFIVVEKLTKGRPKKTVKQVESSDNVGDLFAKLTAEKEDDMFEVVDDEVPINSKKSKLSDEEKAAKKAALEEERAAKKLERETAIALEKEAKKVERETKAALEKEAKKVERETKAALEKEAREVKVAEEKAAREAKVSEEKAAREAKRVLEKELKKAASPKATPKATSKATPKATTKATPVVVVAPVSPAASPKVQVKPFEIDGTQYLKSILTNILYNPKTKEEVGIWDPKTKTINELPDDEDEEEEAEGYETN